MKKLLPLVAIFLLSLSVVAQDTKPPKGFVRNYDKFKDLTEVSFTDSGFLPPYYTGWFRHEGQKLEADIDKFYITFRGYRCTGFCFKSPTLIFIIDGERLAMPRLDNLLSDTATWTLDRDTLSRITGAKLVEYQVGGFEGNWKDKTIPKFKTLLDLGTVKK
jgi:hypothetical protein